MQPAIFHERARRTIQGFPIDARGKLGKAIEDLQYGATLRMPLSRPMPIIGHGAHELRVRGADGIDRAFYVLNTARGVLVFHAFEKKTQTTPSHEIELARRRLQEMLNG